MPKGLLCKTHDKNLRFKYVTNYHYNLKDGIKVKLQKEKSSFAKSAGWGLRAVTAIPNKTCLGSFRIQKKLANHPVVGTYCFPVGDKFKVTHPESLMNKINTIVDKRFARFINCKITNAGTVRTIKPVQAGQFLYATYGVARHKWDIQYEACKARMQKGNRLRNGSEKKNYENDDCCAHCNYAAVKKLPLFPCDICKKCICVNCLGEQEKHVLSYKYFVCRDCLSDPLMRPSYPNRFRKATWVPYHGTFKEKEKRWLRNINNNIYCSTNGGKFHLDIDWKCCRNNVMSLFDQAQYEMENVEFLNLAGSTVNDKEPWDEEVVETLIQMVSRENSHVYGINLGEIYFTKKGIKYLHDNLHRTWIGFIFVEPNYNVFPPKGWFRGTNRNSTLARNRREKPLWYKNGEIAPWYDEEKRPFHAKKETMGKCFFSCLNSKNFGKN